MASFVSGNYLSRLSEFQCNYRNNDRCEAGHKIRGGVSSRDDQRLRANCLSDSGFMNSGPYSSLIPLIIQLANVSGVFDTYNLWT